ncbi:MAG: DUF512 domain-containing protein [Candidatus Gastranaerophilales bacterium]|nr:DUF512 domain-containing protein [Candidatus Gastranaerophilales bacterium]
MSGKIAEVLNNSIAKDLEFKKNDEILKINGVIPSDYIDYKYLLAAENVDIELRRQNGEIEIFEIEKDFDEDLGIVFESAIFDKIKPCLNKCIFCFVDQQPKGLRKSLYIKDDDYRLSYLQGTYVTLTNLKDEDKKRIQKMHLGPLYVSVHTTNPELRAKMLRNPNAANIMKELKWLQKADIPIHTQIVLCPGYNDGVELERTLNDLYSLSDILLSIAIVPLGVTKFRKEPMLTVSNECALETINIIENFNKKAQKNLACASDEFFLKAGFDIPKKDYYSGFAQIEDGVGAIRLLKDDFDKRAKKLPEKLQQKSEFTFATSFAALDIMSYISNSLNKVENVSTNVIPVKSEFWGEHISVAGLITANDLINALKNKNVKNVIIPSVMLRPYTKEFLDGFTTTEVEKTLNCKIYPIKDIYSAKEIVDIICK